MLLAQGDGVYVITVQPGRKTFGKMIQAALFHDLLLYNNCQVLCRDK